MLAFALSTFTAVFFAVDPLATVPLFLAMTAGDSGEHKRRMATRASIVSCLLLLSFAFIGGSLLRYLGISMGAFRMAGGALLFLLAVDMLRAQHSPQRSTPEEEAEGVQRVDVSVFPLAIPMLAGPGAITTVMMVMSRATRPVERAVVLVCLTMTSLLTFVILGAAGAVERRLGQTGLNVVQRLMGLLLAGIAMQFLADGARETFPQALGPAPASW